MVEHHIKDKNKNKNDVDYTLIPQYVSLLEEWDEFLVSDDPKVMKLRRSVSIFCEKIVDYKEIDVGVRARAAKFLLSEPDVEPDVEVAAPAVARQLVPWRDPDNDQNAIPENEEWAPLEDD